jgi:hypothetical protein
MLPTESETRLYFSDYGKVLNLGSHPKRVYTSGQNIYITSTEEIKTGDWYKSGKFIWQMKYPQWGEEGQGDAKKIILTTDVDLIKDGVQPIPDEFLEWFVKNQSCEEVEIINWFGGMCPCKYKIIIPKEEPKTAWVGVLHDRLNEYHPAEYELKDIYQGDGCLPNFPNEELCQIWCDSKYKEEPKQEIWKDIPNYEGLYQVSTFGNVKSLEKYVKGKIENRLQKENILSKRLVGHIGNQYYAVTLCNNTDRKQIKVSVLVAMAFLNHNPNGYVGFIVDHIDNNPLNDNVNNLQVITKRENSSKDKKGISKYTGVTFNKKLNKWRSQIWINGKNKTLGSFDDELEAHRAYQKELQQYLNS